MFISFFSEPKRRVMTLLLIFLLISGCGKSPSSQGSQNTHHPILPALTPVPLGTSVAFNLGGLVHIESKSGFVCSFNDGGLTPGTLVFPTLQATYDQGTLQSLKDYVKADFPSYTGLAHIDTLPYPAFPANLSAFRLAPVDAVNGACAETFHMTNIGNAPIQLSRISVQFTADTQTNKRHYNLIDLCSLLSLGSPCVNGGGGNEDAYVAGFDLHPEKTKSLISTTQFSSPFSQDEGPGPTLQPGDVVKVNMFYSSKGNYLFSLRPSFTFSWPGKQATYPIPQLQETFAFTSSSQFSCFGLRGQQFVEVPINPSKTWCI